MDWRKPQTVQNYLSHLQAVFTLAKPAFGIPLDKVAMQDAMLVARRLGLTAKSEERERRPTRDEMDALCAFWRRGKAPWMADFSAFALFSTRRLSEACRITEIDRDRVLIRDMKHPGQKRGNDVWCDLPPEAVALFPEGGFGKSPDAVTANFTRACQTIGIDDLHFHDLRHEGISRLFEMGWTIPKVASVSGHRDWRSLQRYAHLRQTGAKWKGWRG